MVALPEVLTRGEPARLFPVLADTSKEGRTLSIFLACLQNVEAFGRGMLTGLDVRVGARSRIETFTEVVCKNNAAERSFRPDGLVLVKGGSSQWSALVEAKVGATDLTAEQVIGYLELAKLNGIDAVITLSNQFAPLPSHHPVQIPGSALKRVSIFHWSWMYVLTEASLLLSNEEIDDRSQWFMLNEMVRFLTHASAGVKSFDQMPSAWTPLVNSVLAGGVISANAAEAKEVVGAWHQEVRDLSLILSRQLGTNVDIRTPRAHAADPLARQKDDLATLASSSCLLTTLVVPDAAAPMDVCADIQKRSVTVSMKMKAPLDRRSASARMTWLLRQIQRAQPDGIHVRLFWPGRAVPTQYPLANLRENPDLSSAGREGQSVLSFEVLLVRDLGGRFAQRKNFITDLEAAVPEFYEQVGQHLRTWQPPAPKLREEKAEPGTVAPAALRQEAEAHAQSIERSRDTVDPDETSSEAGSGTQDPPPLQQDSAEARPEQADREVL